MRKLIILSLLVSCATPLMARPDDADDRRAERRARVEASGDESPRESAPRVGREPRFERRSEPGDAGNFGPPGPASDVERRDPRVISHERPERLSRESLGVELPAPAERRLSRRGRDVTSDQPDSVRDWRGPRNAGGAADEAGNSTLRERFERRERRTVEGVWDERRRNRTGSTVPREGTQPPIRVADGDEHRRRPEWRHDWRNDRRHDWRRHRDRNRSTFHLGIYYDPFGWNYRRHNIGWRLWPDYYRSSYWIHDPWMYRLPTAFPGTRWIRYHNDALLVDTWTGEVMDVIHGFFW